MINTYFAGKIKHRDWRHTLFPELRGVQPGEVNDILINKAGIKYTGPWFVSCDHGCYHGENSHGSMSGDECIGENVVNNEKYHNWISSKDIQRDAVKDICLSCIDDSHFMFVYLDSADCYGTIAEIGYAVAKGIWVTMFIKKGIDTSDIWLVKHMCNRVYEVNDEVEAFKTFVDGLINNGVLL